MTAPRSDGGMQEVYNFWLAATAALSGAGVAHRRKLKGVAEILADSFDTATRRGASSTKRIANSRR